jgi:Zinc carboxypeptidase/Immune inhibitor A peptidase M6
MNKSRWARGVTAGLAALVAAATTTTAAQAAGQPVEPLNQYEVSGKITTDQLARAGFDLHEVVSRDGKLTIVATPAQAKSLEAKGATVQPLSEARTMAAPATPLTQPTHGYDVFRPWSLKPAACPGTCATPNVPLKQFYRDLARRYPELVKEETIGTSLLGQPIKAYKVTYGARWTRDGSKPVTLFESTQHAREWISAEVNRRLFSYFLEHRRDREVRRLLERNEVWFIPIMNPDGYDYTFTQKATRLWRKNLRDVNGDGVIDPAHDGVDMNRNWPEKWNYDLEGSSDDPSSETYHGSGPASEPEVAAARRLHQRLKPRFLIDYHSFAQLILWPEGWQVETNATDAPLMQALAGDDDHPAVAGFDPDVSAELYTTNGDVTGDAYNNWGTQAYTVELSGGTGDGVGGTVDGPDSLPPGGFVFQDDEVAVQAEFTKNLAFALDLVKSAKRPDQPVSHLGNTAPDFVPSAFSISTGDPQVVEVNAKRSLGDVKVFWQVGNGRIQRGGLGEYGGGEKYGEPGRYYHRLRGQVHGARPGDTVKVWFASRWGRSSTPFTYTLKSDTDNKVLLMVAEDYSGNSSDVSGTPYPGPLYQDDYSTALTTAGVAHDVYDVDANGRTAASALGVLSHYKAVIWETGEDLYVREPGQPGGTGTSKLADDEVLNVRDYLNDGGKALVAGKLALQGGWDQLLWNPLGAPPAPFCKSNQTDPSGDDDPPGQTFNCVVLSNDFQQYWLGAYLPIGAAADTDQAAALPFEEAGGPFGSASFTVNGEDSAQNQDNVYSFLTTSSILPKDQYPQFSSDQAVKFDRPPAFDPPTGTHYAFSGAADDSYKRLSRTVDLTDAADAALTFTASFDTEPGWDFLVVEAHTVGQDDWTTLVDRNGHTTDDLSGNSSCPQIPITDEHPFMEHYVTLHPESSPGAGDATCSNGGTTGTFNAANGNSGGFVDFDVDLSAYAGKQVEVSITYVSDEGVQGLGVFVDDAKITADGTTLTETSFEDGLGGWEVPGAPAGSGGNANDWTSATSVGYVDGPGVATGDTLYWGFGLEGVTGAGTRATLVKDALAYLGASG